MGLGALEMSVGLDDLLRSHTDLIFIPDCFFCALGPTWSGGSPVRAVVVSGTIPGFAVCLCLVAV